MLKTSARPAAFQSGLMPAHDIDAMVACFTSDAAVRDENRDIVGSDAIRAWKIETSARYRITAEPIECLVEPDRTIVGFSDDGRIGSLEVH